MYSKLIFLLVFVCVLISCDSEEPIDSIYKDHTKYSRYRYSASSGRTAADATMADIEIFKGTAVWELAIAVYEQDTLRIDNLVHAHNDFLSVREPKVGMSLLDWSVLSDRYFSARELLKLGADPNLVNDKVGPTLDFAAYKNSTSVYVKLLLDFGANVKYILNEDGVESTALHVAACHNLESVKLLVDAGADVNIFDSANSVLAWACLHDDIRVIAYLVEKGADYNTPLMITGDKVSYLLDDLKNPELKWSNDVGGYIRDSLIRFLEQHNAKHN